MAQHTPHADCLISWDTGPQDRAMQTRHSGKQVRRCGEELFVGTDAEEAWELLRACPG